MTPPSPRTRLILVIVAALAAAITATVQAMDPTVPVPVIAPAQYPVGPTPYLPPTLTDPAPLGPGVIELDAP